MGHSHDDVGGRGQEQEQTVGPEIAVYQRCTCSCGSDWNDIVRTRPNPDA